jgi:hypothetical protein
MSFFRIDLALVAQTCQHPSNDNRIGVHHVGHRLGRHWTIGFGQVEEEVEHA